MSPFRDSLFENCLILTFILMAAAAVRYPLISVGAPFFNSDTAILHLMARHLMKGEFSLYYWGEHYYGALDWVLLGPMFKFFGYNPLVADLLPFFFTLTFLAMYDRYLVKTTDPMTAHFSTLILAVGSPYFLRITFTTYNYIVTLNFGMAFLLLARRMSDAVPSRRAAFLLGIVMGFAWYYLRLIIIFWAGAVVALFVARISTEHVKRARGWLASLTAAGIWNDWILLGSFRGSPWLTRFLVLVNLGNLVNFALACFLWFHGDWIELVRGHWVKLFFDPIFASSLQLALLVVVVVSWRRILLSGRALTAGFPVQMWSFGFLAGYSPALFGTAMGLSPTAGGSFPTLRDILTNLRLLGFEIIPDMLGRDTGGPWMWSLLAVSFGGVGIIFVEAWRYSQKRLRGKSLPALHPFAALAIINVLFCIFLKKLGDRSTSRYLLPMFITMPLGVILLLRKIYIRPVAWILLGLFLYGNYRANAALLAVGERPAPFTRIARYLVDQHYSGGYADYWVGYAITALADEKIILAPLGDNDRYHPYLDYVRSLKTVVIVGAPLSPVDSLINIKGVTYKVVKIDRDSEIALMVAERVFAGAR